MFYALMLGAALAACTSHSARPEQTTAPVEAQKNGKPCGDHVRISFDTDEDMLAGVPTAAADGRVRKVWTETKEQAHERFRDIFARQQDLVARSRVEGMPAGLMLQVKPGTDVRAVAEDLKPKYPKAAKVVEFVHPVGQPDVQECPPSGEWPAK
ncbi:hypothetical protein N8J89_16695 [Crossiella sp. CA-258035]|uniref:hypothetical protein n=1 Tax=Crossiella sp. CA-258035 TaxID=2981138 RepID=UPI0024BD463D|nr:hypothetical protein [Crossiella sp. CA-258035]WHT22637.1 hypothetical protein N8J89_16695 [Crossiella sp. CA-258035]